MCSWHKQLPHVIGLPHVIAYYATSVKNVGQLHGIAAEKGEIV